MIARRSVLLSALALCAVALAFIGPRFLRGESVLCQYAGGGQCNPYYLPRFNGLFRALQKDGTPFVGNVEVLAGDSVTFEWDARLIGFDSCLAESTAKRDDWYGPKATTDRQTLPNQKVSQTYYLYCHHQPDGQWHQMPAPILVFVRPAVCGDGKIEFPESCDDGNTQGNDSCPANCGSVANARECKDGIDNDSDGTIDALNEVPLPPGGTSTLPPLFEMLPERTTVPILYHGTDPIGYKNPGERDYYANGEFKIVHFVQNNFCPAGSFCFEQDGKSVGNDPESAKKICEYAGYSTVASTQGGPFASCGDNTIALWRSGTWTTVPACSFNNQMWAITCSSPIPTSPPSACNDGQDNDGDGKTDFPSDTGCASARDQSEVPHDIECKTPETLFESPTQCSDTKDNEGDGLIDIDDPGCSSPADDNESDGTSQCQDGLDNDDDGAIDYPADFSCANKQDLSEATPKAQCQDGIDNDGDGRIDVSTFVKHEGSTDPLTEGWSGLTRNVTHNGGFTDDDDPTDNVPGVPAWKLGAQRGYKRILSAAEEGSEQGAGEVQPWRLSVSLRIPVNNIDVRQANGVVVSRKVGNKNFTLLFGSTSDFDPVVAVLKASGTSPDNPRPGFQAITLPGGSVYHNYELVFRPSVQKADLYVDGVKRITDIEPTSNAAGDSDERAIVWSQGNTAQTQAHVAWVRFMSNGLGDTDCDNNQDNDESNPACNALPMFFYEPGTFIPKPQN